MVAQPGIWVTAEGDPGSGPRVANPIAGKNYTVSVEVQNFYPDVGGPWVLFVCWGIPFTGTMPSVNIGQILEGSMTPYGPVGGPTTVTVPPRNLDGSGDHCCSGGENLDAILRKQ